MVTGTFISLKMLTRSITANDFIKHSGHAVSALFNAILSEESRFNHLKESHEREYEMYSRDFITSDINDDFDGHHVQHKYAQAAEAKIQAFLVSQSIEVLCGSVYQIARQGISLVLKDGERFTKGRKIGSQNLSNIIWHGRIQAMHWEDGVPTNPHTKRCFETLKNEFGNQFEYGPSPRNMAWDLWSVIRWASYDDYLKDLNEILDDKK